MSVFSGVKRMYRVPLCAVAVLLLAGCGTSSNVSTAGFARSDEVLAKPSMGVGAPDKTASLQDSAPLGSWAKAPKGALADRDYTTATLDAEKARDLVNAYRRQHNLKPLTLNANLTDAAKAHSRDLARWDRISHFGSDGSNPWDRVKRTGYNPRVAAENVGTGQATLEEVLKGWKESEGHNKNLLLPDASQMGIALVRDPKTEFKTFWTLVLGSPAPAATAQVARPQISR
jgi:uncharacterized protein YkwD